MKGKSGQVWKARLGPLRPQHQMLRQVSLFTEPSGLLRWKSVELEDLLGSAVLLRDRCEVEVFTLVVRDLLGV